MACKMQKKQQNLRCHGRDIFIYYLCILHSNFLPASEMTYTVSSGALDSAPTNQVPYSPERVAGEGTGA